MMRNKYLLAAVLAFAPLATQAAETVYTFETVTGIEHRSADLAITGVLVGDTTPTTVSLPWQGNGVSEMGSRYNRCLSLFDLVLSQPGAHRLIVATDYTTQYDAVGNPSQVLIFKRCASQPQP